MRLKRKRRKAVFAAILALAICMLAGCMAGAEDEKQGEADVQLIWYQVGEAQKDDDLVLEAVNAYIREKLGVTLDIRKVGWADYNQKMRVLMQTGDDWDLCFTSSWTNDYLQNVQKGVFLQLDGYLKKQGKQLYKQMDPRFWEAAKVGGKIYGVPSEKEIGNCPVWVFTKEYVDKYDIPYQDIHELEDLEPWLALIKEKEPDVTPLYLTKDFTAPTYMDKICDPVGIEYDDEALTVKNVFETKKMRSVLATMRKFYVAGYINPEAPVASNDKSVKRFVTKGDGQPYAELIWGKDLGYEVVVSQIMDTKITNASARGAMTAVNQDCAHPKKAVELLNLIHTDEYLRNLLNYGIKDVHWDKCAPDEKELKAAQGKPYVYDFKIKLRENAGEDYSVPYWVQGGLFPTYVLDNEPLDKWAMVKEFNDASREAPSFGFDFDLESVSVQAGAFRNVLDEFGKALYTGSVNPDRYLPRLQKKLEAAGIQEVIREMQRQINEWKNQRP